MNRVLKHIIAFTAFFALFYFEPTLIGPVSVGIVWKTLLLFGFILYIILVPSRSRMGHLTFWGALFALEGLLNPSLFVDPVETISFAVKNAYIPIGFEVFSRYYRRHADPQRACYRALLILSVYVILSSIPFHLNLLQPIKTGYDLSIFNVEGSAFLGLFQNAHASAVTYASASLVVFYHLSRAKGWGFAIFLAMMLLGFITTGMTLARTGIAILVVGMIVITLLSHHATHRLVGLAMAAGGSLAGLVLFQTSEIFRMRILGQNSYTIASGAASDDVSSGRLRFWQTAMDNFLSQDLTGQFFGMGPTIAMNEMERAVGLRIYAHNGFVDVLQFQGYLGAAFFAMFLFSMYRLRRLMSHDRVWHPLLSIMLLAYVAQMLFQGERVFLADIVLALSLAVARITYAKRRALQVRRAVHRLGMTVSPGSDVRA